MTNDEILLKLSNTIEEHTMAINAFKNILSNILNQLNNKSKI